MAILETNLVYVGQNKYRKDIFNLAFERNGLLAVNFQKRSIIKSPFEWFIKLEKCSHATFRCLVGHMWPAGRTLPRLDLRFRSHNRKLLPQNS